MAKHNRTLQLLATKLGLAEDDKVLSKAAEFHRLLQTKSTAGSNITDTSKVVICLDLAASLHGGDLDIKSAIKYSGLKASAYTNSRKIVENLLELNSERLTSSMLCLTLQCAGVQDLADKILEQYQRLCATDLDLKLPQYVCMAVYHACRLNKVKVSKTKLVDKSRLKPAQWSKLDADWAKFVDEHFAQTKKKRKNAKRTNEIVENEVQIELDVPKMEDGHQDAIEPYEDWKRRMLDTAYAELKVLEKTRNSVTPRKSPRKLAQKFSPYKNVQTPTKSNGVRLLFL